MKGSVSGEWVFRLPMPPSVNKAYATIVNGAHSFRVATAKLKAFKRQAGLLLMTQARPKVPINTPVKVEVILGDFRGDTDNRIKAAFDALVNARILADDKYIVGYSVEKATGPGIIVTLRVVR
jgi:Holliday junction resolvase RusA-like endonuclease